MHSPQTSRTTTGYANTASAYASAVLSGSSVTADDNYETLY